jgi:cold shock CspA family protein
MRRISLRGIMLIVEKVGPLGFAKRVGKGQGSRDMPEGTITRVEKRKWLRMKVETYIIPDDGGEPLLVHFRVAAGQPASMEERALKEGDRVSYEGTQQAWGTEEHMQATDVRLIQKPEAAQ